MISPPDTKTPVFPTSSGDALFVVNGHRLFIPLSSDPEETRTAMKRINLLVEDFARESERKNAPR